jgi:hypothetical protein
LGSVFCDPVGAQLRLNTATSSHRVTDPQPFPQHDFHCHQSNCLGLRHHFFSTTACNTLLINATTSLSLLVRTYLANHTLSTTKLSKPQQTAANRKIACSEVSIMAPLNFIQWIDGALPHKGQSLRDELKCYSLPYGGIGFGSHILTYYTVIMLAAGRSPWRFKRNKHWRFDAFLSLVGLIWTVGATIFTMIRCRQRWEFVVMAFWKMMMSLTLSAIATHAAVIVRRKLASRHISKDDGSESGKEQGPTGHNASDISDGSRPIALSMLQPRPNLSHVAAPGSAGQTSSATEDLSETAVETAPKEISSSQVWGWTSLYALGVMVGYSGLFSLVRQSWHIHAVRDLTISYILVTCTFILLGLFSKSGAFATSVGLFIIGTGMIAALYSDWILAAISGNYGGVPDGNNEVLYWTYIAAKRLPFASF